MEFTYRIRGLKKLQDATAQAPAKVASEMTLAMNDAVTIVESEAVGRTRMGPGHFGSHMAEAYSTNVSLSQMRVRGRIDNALPQSRWLEYGTAAHSIPLGHGRAMPIHLRSGDVVFSSGVSHPGEKPQRILHKSLRSVNRRIKDRFVEAITGVTASLAVSGD